jgi:hypothetical protein
MILLLLSAVAIFFSSNRLVIGAEHPFNPVVALNPPSSSSPGDSSAPFSFYHAKYILTPFTFQMQIQANALREAQIHQQQNNSANRNRLPYRRPPPILFDSHSMISQGMNLHASGGDVSPDVHYYRANKSGSFSGKSGPGGGNHRNYYPNSPGKAAYYRNNPNHLLPPQGMPMFPMSLDGVNYIPIPPPLPSPSGGPMPHPMFPGQLPIFPPPFIPGATPPHFYPPQMHNSLSSSVSSSYGQHNSPLSQSPMNASYMLPPPPHIDYFAGHLPPSHLPSQSSAAGTSPKRQEL